MIAAFPNVTFIWKYEQDDAFAANEAAQVANAMLSKWTPQGDLLSCVHLFRSHAGSVVCISDE